MADNKPRIALIHPAPTGGSTFEKVGRSDLPPLGILYLAAVLIEKGYKVQAYDLGLIGDPASLVRQVARFKPDIAAFSTLADTSDVVFDMVSQVRKEIPGIGKVIAGGPDATCRPDHYLGAELFDAVFIGEAEHTLPAFLENPADSDNAVGILIKTGDESSLPAPTIPDEVPFPARHLLPLKKYRGGPAYKQQRYTTSVFSHRGCPYRCTFCEKSVHPGPVRFRSADSIFREIMGISKDFGINDVRFIDDVFTVRRDILEGFCDLVINSGQSLSWMCCGRVDLVKEDVLAKMKQAGCYRIEYGIESGADRVLAMVDKGADLRKTIEAIDMTRKAGIESIGNFILGFPTETEAEMKQTVAFSRNLDLDYAVYFLFTPFIGAPIQDQFTLQWDLKQEGARAPSDHYLVPTKRVLDLIDKAYSGFYFRPKVILKRIASIKSGWIIWDLAKMAAAKLFGRIFVR